MRKNNILMVFLVLLCAVLFLSISCGDNSPIENDEITGTIVVDLSNINSTDTTITVSGLTEVAIDNLNLSYGVFVSTFESGIKKANENAYINGQGNKNGLYKTKNGDYFVVPDKDNHGQFQGSDIGISHKTEIHFSKFKNKQSDFIISSEEYKNIGVAIRDEFYYVDFKDECWSGLDPERVVIVSPQFNYSVIGNYSIIQYGLMNKNNSALYDFSLYSGFGIYAYISKNIPEETEWSKSFYVMSPLKMSENPIVKKANNDGISVIDFDLPLNESYVIKIAYKNASELACLIQDLDARYYDGTPRDVMLIPFIDESNKIVSYYTGIVDKPFLFTIDSTNYTDSQVGDFSITYEKQEVLSFPDLYDLKDIPADGYVITSPSSSGYYTFGYKLTQPGDYYKLLDWFSDENYKMPISHFNRGKGTSSDGLFENIKQTSELTGYIVFNLNDESVSKGTNLAKLTREQLKYLECSHVKWDPEKQKYVCVGDDGCNKEYDYNSFFSFGDSSFDTGIFAELEGLGEVRIRKGFDFYCSEYPDFAVHVGGNATGPTGEYGTHGFLDDTHTDTWLQLYIKEVWTDENHMVTKAKFDIKLKSAEWTEPLEFKDAVFEYRHIHNWDFSNDTYAVCNCGMTAPYSSRYIEYTPESQMTINVKGLRGSDTVNIVVPETDFDMVFSNCSQSFPAPDKSITVYFIASNPNCHLTLSGGGSKYDLFFTY